MADGDTTSAVGYHRHIFAWRGASHPFAQRRLPSPADADTTVYRSPAAGSLHALVADHVVAGRVVFPGAGYLELARAASKGVTSASSGEPSLQGVFFLAPLVLDGDDQVRLIRHTSF